MAKVNILDIMKTRMKTPLEFKFESLCIPPMECYLTPQDVNTLHDIATSVKLASDIKLKYKLIDGVMRPRGFKRFSAGTNRIVYSYYEDERFVVKIAVDKVGMQDNPAELNNQFLLQPYVSKMFYISPCGTVGFSERVLPIKNKAEFKEIAPDVFDILVNKILGKYVVEDIGTKYFMNYGVRAGYGPVLLDYPYVYKLDGKKLFCTAILPETGYMCDGEIDYDDGFNSLICTKCGRKYLACDLKDDSPEESRTIRVQGGNEMKVVVKYGDMIIRETNNSDAVMTRPEKNEESRDKFNVTVRYGDMIVRSTEVTGLNEEETRAVENTPKPPMFRVTVKNGDTIVRSSDANLYDEEDVSEDIPVTTTEISHDEIKTEEQPDVSAGEITVEEEVVTSDSTEEEFENVDDQSFLNGIISARDDDEYGIPETDSSGGEESVEEEQSSSESDDAYDDKYDVYDEEYGRVKVNKAPKFNNNRDRDEHRSYNNNGYNNNKKKYNGTNSKFMSNKR